MAERRSWLRVIGALKRLIKEFGPLWPNSTKLSGYSEVGPFHCGDCVYRKMENGETFKDAEGKGRCFHPVVIADDQVKRDEKMIPTINIEHGCCEFVEYEEGYVEGTEDEENGKEEA